MLLLLLVVCVPFTHAQFRQGPPSPPASNPNLGADPCTPGELLPGPSCDQFYTCTPGRIRPRKVLFRCGPGTQFDQKLQVCVHDSGPCNPIVGAPAPPQSASSDTPCQIYIADENTEFDCPEPGFYPSTRDCARFFTCINTMGCIVRGFTFKCPKGHLYSPAMKTCQAESAGGECLFSNDESVGGNVQPAVELQSEKIDQFFQTSAYWDFMEFLPQNLTTRGNRPADFTRDSNFSFQGK